MGSMNMPLVCRMNQKKKWWHTLEMWGLSPAQEKSSVWFNVIPCYKRWSLLPSSACCPRWPTRHPASPVCQGVRTTSPLRRRAYFPPFQSGLVPCSDCSNRPEVNFEPRPSASSLSLLPLRTPLPGTRAPDFEDVCAATCSGPYGRELRSLVNRSNPTPSQQPVKTADMCVSHPAVSIPAQPTEDHSPSCHLLEQNCPAESIQPTGFWDRINWMLF